MILSYMFEYIYIYIYIYNWIYYLGCASNRNEYKEYILWVKRWPVRSTDNLTSFMYSTDCLEICEPEPPGTLRVCPGLYRDYFTFYLACN